MAGAKGEGHLDIEWREMTDCGHDHGLGHAHWDPDGPEREAGGRLIAALLVIVVFMVVEVIGGVISGSLALLADAAHMMTDAIALALAASAHWMARKPADEKLHFGYRRIQVLAAFVNGLALVALVMWIIIEAVRRSVSPIEVEWRTMLVIAVLGLLANAVAFRVLHQSSQNDINVRGAMLHVIGDLLGSFAAVIAAVVIATTGWMRIDPLLSLIVAGLIGWSAIRLLRETAHILLEGAPDSINVKAMVDDLQSASVDIVDIHQVQVWQLTPDQPRVTFHATIRDGARVQPALELLKSRLQQHFGIHESTIQLETHNCCDGAGNGPREMHERGRHSHSSNAPHAHSHSVDFDGVEPAFKL